jgi:Fe-S cluster assembly iron-binding protein IscA
MITITETAKEKIQDIIAEENNPAIKLRVFVQGG